MKTIKTLGEDFCKKHDWLLTVAWINNVAICGGCAAAIGRVRTDYDPKDLDLVSTKSSALDFIRKITDFLLERSVHFRIYSNSKNDYVPFPAVAHFRIQCPFWVPICLFVLPEEEFRYYRIQGNHLLQIPRDVKRAADSLSEKDSKDRIANEPLSEEESSIDLFAQEEEATTVSVQYDETVELEIYFGSEGFQSSNIGNYPRIF